VPSSPRIVVSACSAALLRSNESAATSGSLRDRAGWAMIA
jgi:hypothetical protein